MNATIDDKQVEIRVPNLTLRLWEEDGKLTGMITTPSSEGGYVMLSGAKYSDETIWPDGFDPEKAGAVKRDSN